MDPQSSASSQILTAFLRGDSDAAMRMLRHAGGAGVHDVAAAVRNAYREAKDRESGHGASADAADRAAVSSNVRVPTLVHAALREGDVLAAAEHLRDANPGHDMVTLGTVLDQLRHGGARGQVAPDRDARSATAHAQVRSPGTARSPFAHAGERPPTVAPGDQGGGIPVMLAIVASIAAVAWWALG